MCRLCYDTSNVKADLPVKGERCYFFGKYDRFDLFYNLGFSTFSSNMIFYKFLQKFVLPDFWFLCLKQPNLDRVHHLYCKMSLIFYHKKHQNVTDRFRNQNVQFGFYRRPRLEGKQQSQEAKSKWVVSCCFVCPYRFQPEKKNVPVP